jgi:hypothetical protein
MGGGGCTGDTGDRKSNQPNNFAFSLWFIVKSFVLLPFFYGFIKATFEVAKLKWRKIG